MRLQPPPPAQESSAPLIAPEWVKALAPFLEHIDQKSRLAAREEYVKLLAEQEAAVAETRRNEEPISVKQAAELLGVTAQTTWEWQKRGLLPSRRIGRRIFFSRGEVLAALQANTHQDGRRKYARRSGKEGGENV